MLIRSKGPAEHSAAISGNKGSSFSFIFSRQRFDTIGLLSGTASCL